MADTRPADDPVTALANLQKQVDDLQSTLLARVARMPTGTVMGTLLAAAPANTLLLNGSAVTRATYPVLWQWVQDNSLVKTGLFTNGDGSTTFGLPDFRGRVLLGAGTLAVGATVGADTITLSTAQMPSHGHSVTIQSVGDHGHGLSGDGGNHGNHNGGLDTIASALQGYQDFFHGVASNTGVGNAGHSHGGGTGGGGGHSHTVNQSNAGSGSAIDVRQSSIAINWIIWA